jgi:hypothetical protein
MKQGVIHGQINSFVQFLDITFKGVAHSGPKSSCVCTVSVCTLGRRDF